jgi:hypothetical protein
VVSDKKEALTVPNFKLPLEIFVYLGQESV